MIPVTAPVTAMGVSGVGDRILFRQSLWATTADGLRLGGSAGVLVQTCYMGGSARASDRTPAQIPFRALVKGMRGSLATQIRHE